MVVAFELFEEQLCDAGEGKAPAGERPQVVQCVLAGLVVGQPGEVLYEVRLLLEASDLPVPLAGKFELSLCAYRLGQLPLRPLVLLIPGIIVEMQKLLVFFPS
jgi:hypothetical protein